MPALSPDPPLTRRSIEIYLRLAYDGPPPDPVATLLRKLEDLEDGSYFAEGPFEAGGSGATQSWSLRLGNPRYPFMKLRIDRRPNGDGFLYSVDTHDNLGLSKDSPEYEEFKDLMDANKVLADAIEAAWGDSGVPTFKSLLKADLARRRQGDAR